ncbi:MAG TPA: hypothetical protein DCW90_22810 [Lachnospiraceae bacterium]|nr:hypothetical protein [Lachnospiraceae bacterium]
MYKYRISYDGGQLRDSSDLGYLFETEEEATEEAKMDVESYIGDWKIEGSEYDHELFDIEIEEV